jgi:hypothetical protein
VALTGLTIRGGAGAGVLVNGGSSVSLANSTISGGAGAIDINDGGANLTTSLSNLTLFATGGNVLDIDGSGAGTVTVTNMSGITIRGGTGETGGLSVRSATFDANTATAGIQTVNAGRMEVGTTAARVNGQGVFLTDVTGSLSFADLDIANSGATGCASSIRRSTASRWRRSTARSIPSAAPRRTWIRWSSTLPSPASARSAQPGRA